MVSGAGIEFADLYGNTPLMQAVSDDFQGLAAHLINWGAKVEALNRVLKTILGISKPQARVLIETLADHPGKVKNEKPLHSAVRLGNLLEVEKIINNHLKDDHFNVNEEDIFGQTPLYIALVGRNYLVALSLLRIADPFRGRWDCMRLVNRLARSQANNQDLALVNRQTVAYYLWRCWLIVEAYNQLIPLEVSHIILNLMFDAKRKRANPSIQKDQDWKLSCLPSP